jgi:hypothetical protein
MNAARNVEAIVIAKQRTVQGSWVWTLGSRTGDIAGERELEDFALPGSLEVQHL